MSLSPQVCELLFVIDTAQQSPEVKKLIKPALLELKKYTKSVRRLYEILLLEK